MILHHRIARNYWLHVRLRHYPAFARSIGPAPDIRDQVKLAIQLVWPLARSVYLLNGVHDLSYRPIATCVGVDFSTVELFIAAALVSIWPICYQFVRAPVPIRTVLFSPSLLSHVRAV